MKNQGILNLPNDLANKQPIVLFDGECTLCSYSVRFLLRHNRSGNLRFASIQSAIGSKIVLLAGEATVKADSLFFLQDNKLFGYSTAALKITAHLDFPFNVLRIFIIVPVFIRDTIYRFVAKHRYSWFGRKSFCLTDGKDYHKRLLS